ncbi:MAG: Pilus assembly protein MshL [uncultured Campylobacterales bacterium]|uniref:Pilus assembly protein MshL n=1 Tax=uncultured Campylobacterales bacterium TaxID=352960 RepID=A0A6S6SZV1_9BACT|nr:MAG: Pilus assembly protein MshL [uncultured Campylobacterales bacterium]
MKKSKSIFFNIATFILLSSVLYSATSYGICDKNKKFNINILDSVTIKEVIDKISKSCSFTTVVKDSIANTKLKAKSNSINIRGLKLDKVLNILVEDNGLFYDFEDDVLRIYGNKIKTFKINYVSSSRAGKSIIGAKLKGSGEENNDNTDENTIASTDSFDFWDQISDQISKILKSSSQDLTDIAEPIINKETGLITISGTIGQLNAVEKYIELLKDRLYKQVLIDVSIVSVALSQSNKTGIDWSKFQLDINPNSSGNNQVTYTSTDYDNPFDFTNTLNLRNTLSFSIEGLLNFLDTQGKSKVVSNPKILAMNNQQALITIGDNINYRIQTESSTGENNQISVTYEIESVFIGILLNITPEISNDDEITLRINPSISNFKYGEDELRQDTVRVLPPDTVEKKLSTVIRTKNKNTVILGGLITTNNDREQNGVPILRSIPLLGKLFSYESDVKTTEELIFVITPKIIDLEHSDEEEIRNLIDDGEDNGAVVDQILENMFANEIIIKENKFICDIKSRENPNDTIDKAILNLD